MRHREDPLAHGHTRQHLVHEVRRLLAPAFRIERAFAPLRSARGRQGREWMILARRTGA